MRTTKVLPLMIWGPTALLGSPMTSSPSLGQVGQCPWCFLSWRCQCKDVWLRAGGSTPSFLPSCASSFCFPNSSLMNTFFSFNEHPLFKKSHWHLSLFCCFPSVTMNISLSIFFLHHSLSHLPAWGSTEWLWRHGLSIWPLLVHDHLFLCLCHKWHHN